MSIDPASPGAPPPLLMSSDGVILIYGRDSVAIEAGRRLQDALDVSVLLQPDTPPLPLPALQFPVARGQIRTASGHFGAFQCRIDHYVPPEAAEPGLRAHRPAQQDALSRCDIILDLSGGTPLFTAPELRDGYLRADPRDTQGWHAAVLKAQDLIGTFEKPRYIRFTDSRCAHSRSQITGCTRCLDTCPAGAIAPSGNQVQIDPYLCAGCGQCAAVCPTGAAAYTVPSAEESVQRVREVLLARQDAPGATLLIHDAAHGTPLVEASRIEQAWPDNVLAFCVNEVTQVGLETLAAALLYGAAAVRLLVRARPRHDIASLRTTLQLLGSLLHGLGMKGERVALLETDDPQELTEMLGVMPPLSPVAHPSTFLPLGGDKPAMQRQLLEQLRRAAACEAKVVPLPSGAPFGAVQIDVEGCTLCLSCVSACPTSALQDNSDLPLLKFTESACIQCGLCQATCPEKVIELVPQMDFRANASVPRTLKSEQPFCCVRCGKPFGVRSIIERVTAKLADKHWMFKDAASRLELIKMCDDCRVAAVAEQDIDPYGPPRALVRTTDDYLREAAQPKKGS